MDNQTGPYQVLDLSPERRAWLNILELSRPTLHMYGLLEVDVTIARQFIAKRKERTGETFSFTGYLVFCLAQAVAEDNVVQSYLKGRRQLVRFDDVNVGLMIERKVGEKHTLMGYVIQGANRKTYQEVHQEIRSAQSTPVLPNTRTATWFFSAMQLPWPLSRIWSLLCSTWPNAIIRWFLFRW